MTRLSKLSVSIAFLMLIFIPILLLQNGRATWTTPEQITNSTGVLQNEQIAVCYDGFGYVHFASVENIPDTNQNFLYYGNNSKPGYTYSDFMEDDQDKVEVGNYIGDNINLTALAYPSIAASATGTPIVGFQALVNQTGNTDAFASVINPQTGSFRRDQLTFQSTPTFQYNPYNTFNQIVNYNSLFIASQNGTSSNIVSFQDPSTFNPSNETVLDFLGHPNKMITNGSNLYVAAGKTLLIYNATNMLNLGNWLAYYAFPTDINSMWISNQTQQLFLAAGNTLYAFSITNPSPVRIASILLPSYPATAITGLYMGSSESILYITTGITGVVEEQFSNNQFTYLNTQTSLPAVSLNDIFLNPNDGHLYLAGADGIYSMNLTNPVFPTLPTRLYTTPSSPNIALAYNATLDTLVSCTPTALVVIDNYESTSPSEFNMATASAPLSVVMSGTEAYAATQTSGIAWLNTANLGGGYTYSSNPSGYNYTCVTAVGNYVISGNNVTDINVYTTGLTYTSAKYTSCGGGPMFVDSNGYLYINDQRNGLIIANLQNPNQISLAGMEPLNGTFYGGIYANNQIVYIAGGWATPGMAIVDATNFGNIQAPNYYRFNNTPLNSIVVTNNATQTAGYAVEQGSLNSILYFNLTASALIPGYNTTFSTGVTVTYPQNIAVSGSNLYITGNGGVQPFNFMNDMQNPAAGSAKSIAANLIKIEDNVVYTSIGTNEIYFYDIANPATTYSIATANSVSALDVYSCAVFCVMTGSGLGVYDASMQNLTPSTMDTSVTVAFMANGTALALWGNNNGIFYRAIYPSGILSHTYQVTGTTGTCTNPQMQIAQINGTTFIDVIYISSTDGGLYFLQSQSIGGTFTGVASLTDEKLGGAQASTPRLSIENSTVGVVWELAATNQVAYAESLNNGTTFAVGYVTSSGDVDSNPDCYVSASGFMEVIYQKQMDPLNYTIECRNNYNGALFTANENNLVDYNHTGSYSTSWTNPVCAEQNGTVIIMYQGCINYGAGWGEPDIYVIGYQDLNYNMAGNYQTLTIQDDPGGQFLFAGMTMQYNSSVITPLNLTFQIVDTVTGASWMNNTIIPGTGGVNSVYFWSPGNYFITNNPYMLYIYNGTNMANTLLKVTINTFNYNTQTTFNVSIPSTNGTFTHYDLSFTPILYQNTVSLPQDSDGYENVVNPYFGSLSSTDEATYVFFNLQGNRLYNFYLNALSATTNTSGHVKLTMLNASTQLTASATPFFVMNTKNQSVVQFECPQSGEYTALIEPYFVSDYQQTLSYEFYCSACPLPCTLTTPGNQTWVSHDQSTTYEVVFLNWTRDLHDNTIYKYQIEIYNNVSLTPANLVYSDTLLGINNETQPYTLTQDGIYYWRVRAIDSNIPNDIGNWSAIGTFNYESQAPDAPVVVPLPITTNSTFVTITWNAAYCGVFSVPTYFVYWATQPVFVQGQPPPAQYLYQPASGGITNLFIQIPNLLNKVYYFAIVSENNVGLFSNASNMVNITVAIGGYVSASNYTLSAQVGDSLQYEVTYVDSTNLTQQLLPQMEFDYNYFVEGTQFNFWVQQVDRMQVYPVMAQFYTKSFAMYEDNVWHVMDNGDLVPITIFAMAPNPTYQFAVAALFVKNNLPDTVVGNETYQTLWRSGTDVFNVNVYTFYGAMQSDGKQASVSFFVEQTSGVLCEIVYYSPTLNYGYSIQLMTSSLTMTESNWAYAPIYLILAVAFVGVVISLIIKKVEF